MGLEHSGTRQRQRLPILVLIGSMEMLVLWLLGKATELTDQHRQYRASTVRNHLVVSTIVLGLQVMNDNRIALSGEDMQLAFKTIHKTVETLAEES